MRYNKPMINDNIRESAQKAAKDFKASWVDLGRVLYTVYKDKLYKEWGFTDFDAYTSKEIHIRRQTATKLLKSYYFLENKEPKYIESAPSVESVDLLRRASMRKDLDKEDYVDLKKKLFESGKDASEVKKGLTTLIRERQELEPKEAWEQKRIKVIKRLLGTLKSLRTELKTTKVLPSDVLKETEKLINRLESEVS